MCITLLSCPNSMFKERLKIVLVLALQLRQACITVFKLLKDMGSQEPGKNKSVRNRCVYCGNTIRRQDWFSFSIIRKFED